MADRVRIVRDEPTRRAAKTLAARLRVTPSEAVRQAVEHYARETAAAASRRTQRRSAFAKLVQLFDGNDAEAEIPERKREYVHG